jgi:hypothetical protein
MAMGRPMIPSPITATLLMMVPFLKSVVNEEAGPNQIAADVVLRALNSICCY